MGVFEITLLTLRNKKTGLIEILYVRDIIDTFNQYQCWSHKGWTDITSVTKRKTKLKVFSIANRHNRIYVDANTRFAMTGNFNLVETELNEYFCKNVSKLIVDFIDSVNIMHLLGEYTEKGHDIPEEQKSSISDNEWNSEYPLYTDMFLEHEFPLTTSLKIDHQKYDCQFECRICNDLHDNVINRSCYYECVDETCSKKEEDCKEYCERCYQIYFVERKDTLNMKHTDIKCLNHKMKRISMNNIVNYLNTDIETAKKRLVDDMYCAKGKEQIKCDVRPYQLPNAKYVQALYMLLNKCGKPAYIGDKSWSYYLFMNIEYEAYKYYYNMEYIDEQHNDDDDCFVFERKTIKHREHYDVEIESKFPMRYTICALFHYTGCIHGIHDKISYAENEDKDNVTKDELKHLEHLRNTIDPYVERHDDNHIFMYTEKMDDQRCLQYFYFDYSTDEIYDIVTNNGFFQAGMGKLILKC